MLDLLKSFFDSTSSRTLLLGPPKSGKTSLIFRLAYEEANKGGTPYILTRKDKIHTDLPHNLSVLFMNETNTEKNITSLIYIPEILMKVNIKYLENFQDMLQFFIGIQALTPRPSLIIFEDFSSYFIPSAIDIISNGPALFQDPKSFHVNNLKDAFLALSLLNDSIKFLNNFLPPLPTNPSKTTPTLIPMLSPEPIKLILTENKMEDRSLQDLLMKFFDNLATLSQMPVTNNQLIFPTNGSINLLPYSLRILYHPEDSMNPPAILATRIDLIENELVYCIEQS